MKIFKYLKNVKNQILAEVVEFVWPSVKLQPVPVRAEVVRRQRRQ